MGQVVCRAICETCDWNYEGANAMGLGVKHSKKYNHTVNVDQYLAYKWINGVRKF